MKKGKNMINQKNDLNMITRKLETELLTFHFDGLEISEITTTTSWMKLHINVLFIKDDVQITKVLYKDYETGLWYYIKDNGMIISHKDTFNHTIKNLIDEMIYDCHIEIEEATEDLDEYEDIIENEDLDGIIENENLDETEETTTRDTIDTLPPHIYNDTDINPVCMKCQDENLLPYNCNDCNNKKLRKNSLYGTFGESEDSEHDRIKYLMDTHSLVPHVSINSHCMETVLYMEELLTQRYGNTIAHKCKMYNNGYYGCPADRQGNRCCGEKWCAETWKRYEAIINPEWHHVSLNTLANLDFDMLDTKRQKYMTIYKLARNTIKSMYKCKSITQYRSLTNRLITYVHSAYRHDRCAIALVQYVRAKIADVNVNCNIQSSVESEEFGYHESRRYN